MHKIKRKALSLLLVLAMLASLLPAGALPAVAEEGNATLADQSDTTASSDALAAPADVQWSSDEMGKATWSKVEVSTDPESGETGAQEIAYSLQLYKDNAAEGEPVIVNEDDFHEESDTTRSHTFKLTEGGTYTFTVQAQDINNSESKSEPATSDALKVCAVTFSGEGVEPHMDLLRVGEGIQLPAENPSREGYTFAGWEDASGNIWQENAPAPESASLTLSPKWELAGYKVTITEVAGGSAIATPASGDQGTTIELTATPAEGYHFLRWETSDNITIDADNTFTMPEQDVTITPVFDRHYVKYGSSNNNGTHSGTCSTCQQTVTVPCTYISSDVCQICGYNRIVITTQPQNVIVYDGEEATFSVVAEGDNVESYQWQVDAGDGNGWQDISSATATSYSCVVDADMNGYQYRCVVSNNGDCAESDAATLTVNKTSITGEPVTYTTHDADGNELPEQSCEKYAVLNDIDRTLGDDEAAKVENNGNVEYWYVLEDTLTTGAITSSGDVHIILKDGASLSVNGSFTLNGSDANLSIYAQSEGDNMGALSVATTSGYDPCGISGGMGSCGNITIHGGHIQSIAYWEYNHSGIGGSGYESCGDIAIYGGYVVATGATYGSGIGAGFHGHCGNITITGGTVIANGGGGDRWDKGGAGIGHAGEGSSGTFSTSENGDAVIFAAGSNGAITDQSQKANWHGVIFENSVGHVYGLEKMPRSFTIPEGNTLIIDEDQTVTIPKDIEIEVNGTLVNEGVLSGNGTLRVNAGGKLSGDGSIADTLEQITPVTAVTLEQEKIELAVGASEQLKATVEPDNATDQALTWTSSNAGVASVDENGKATAHAAGTATITAETANGVSGSCTVTVTEETIDVTSITIDPQEVTLEPGKTATITADVQPETATDRALTWTSEDEKVAIVDDGTITAVAEGTTTITAATANGLTATCEVTVKKAGEETPDPEPGTPSGPIIPSKPSQPEEPSTGVTTGDDNDSTVTTAKPEVSTENGTTSATVTEDMGAAIVEQVKENESASVIIAPEMDKTATNTAVTLPAGTVANIGSDTNADLVITTPVANVTLPNGALAELASAGDAITVSASVENNTVQLNVTAGGENVANVPGGVTLTVPAETAAGTVAVIVREDGTREVVRKSVAGEDNVRIPLDGSATIEIVDNSKDFADVAAGSWYEDAVVFASSHELFNGTSATSFSPDTGMSRGMLATVLCNLERGDGSSLSNSFSDVADDAWYADAIAWAAENGVINGYGDGSVGPDDLITREQMAAMLYNYAGMLGIDTSARADLGAYGDAADVSSWAEDVMSWAYAEGLITGMSDDTLAPQGTATRAQVAAMLERFVRNVL